MIPVLNIAEIKLPNKSALFCYGERNVCQVKFYRNIVKYPVHFNKHICTFLLDKKKKANTFCNLYNRPLTTRTYSINRHRWL